MINHLYFFLILISYIFIIKLYKKVCIINDSNFFNFTLTILFIFFIKLYILFFVKHNYLYNNIIKIIIH